MSYSIKRPRVAVPMALLSVCLVSGPAAAQSSNAYGPAVDTFCRTYDGSTPFATGGCALCHNTGNYKTPKASTWDWYHAGLVAGDYSPFCTGTPANRAPNGTISAPTGNLAIAVGGSVTFQGTGTDPDGNPITYAWDFGVSTATGPGPHVVTYPNAGTYIASLTVSDGTLVDTSPATRTITVQAASACTDADGDGFSVEGGTCGTIDCNDANAAVHPGATEQCGDGIDNNCDNLIDRADPLAVGCAACTDADPVVDLDPRVSRDPARDPAEPLDGLTVSGTLFVFVPSETGIVQVSYYLDERLARTLTKAPWDFAGTAAAGASPFNTRTLTNGWHSIRTQIVMQSGKTQGTSATFLVQNLVPNQAPTCTIDSPAGNQTIATGQSVTFAGTGTDADGDLPLAYAWTFGGAAAASNAQDPGAVKFATAGTFAVTFKVTDSAGLACPNPAQATITVQSPGGGGGGSFTAHPITSGYVRSGHKSDWKSRPAFCQTCHGTNLRGTTASATFAARSWPADDDKTKRYAQGAIVGCADCHGMPSIPSGRGSSDSSASSDDKEHGSSEDSRSKDD